METNVAEFPWDANKCRGTPTGMEQNCAGFPRECSIIWLLWFACSNNKSSSGDEIPERDVTYHLLCLLICHWTTTHLYFQNIFQSIGLTITVTYLMDADLRKALCVSCYYPISCFSSITFSLASSLTIHTRCSANAEGPTAHWQLKSCKMLHKCSTDCIWKSLQHVNDLQGHSRSLPLLPFYRPYTISCQSSMVSISLSCAVFEILTLICQKN